MAWYLVKYRIRHEVVLSEACNTSSLRGTYLNTLYVSMAWYLVKHILHDMVLA
jgi:hypothetical protein